MDNPIRLFHVETWYEEFKPKWIDGILYPFKGNITVIPDNTRRKEHRNDKFPADTHCHSSRQDHL